jgi:hypothetical protein
MTASLLIASAFPPWAWMWLLACGLFLLGKAAVLRTCRPMAASAWMSFVFLWPGMDPRPFAAGRKPGAQVAVAIPKVAWGCVCLLAGIMLVWVLARHLTPPLAAGWCGMVGVILMLHFGVFAFAAEWWRHRGVPVQPIMNQPIAARSLAEFWNLRWNRAFRDLAHRFVFTPSCRRWGPTAGLWTSFAASGLIHELIVTVPAGGGYGQPTAYFLIQALGLSLERLWRRSSRPMAAHAVARWCFTQAFTTLPLFLAFPRPFVLHVMIPFLQQIRALP